MIVFVILYVLTMIFAFHLDEPNFEAVCVCIAVISAIAAVWEHDKLVGRIERLESILMGCDKDNGN